FFQPFIRTYDALHGDTCHREAICNFLRRLINIHKTLNYKGKLQSKHLKRLIVFGIGKKLLVVAIVWIVKLVG
ncbi:MAG: hypothetical protein ACFNUT_03475, partial [Bacteroidota bacterium]